MNTTGLLEYHFGHILSTLRELHAMFPAHVDVTYQKFLADKAKLLGMFHAIGHNAERTDWYQPDSRHENPQKKFEGFHPSRLTEARFTFCFFKRHMHDLRKDPELMKTLACLSGEENEKYRSIQQDRQRRVATLSTEYSDVRMKCWFSLAALATSLLAATAIIAELRQWCALLLFLPPLIGALPLAAIVFPAFKRSTGAAELEKFANGTVFDVLYYSIRTLDAERTTLEDNRKKWKNRWKLGKFGLVSGIITSAGILAAIPVINACAA